MTISSETNVVRYNGNGVTTVFAYTFRILDQTEILVQVKNTSTDVITNKTLTTHYTVSNVGDAAGGNITFLTAPAAGEQVILTRDMAVTQETDYTEYDAFPAETHEEALDRLTMIAQQLSEVDSRCLKIDSGVSGVSMLLGTPVANKYWRWNSSATALEYVDLTTSSTDLTISGTGMMAYTATGTVTSRTLTGTANEITVTNGSGISGAPTFSLPAALTFTGKTVTGGTFASPTVTTPTINTILNATYNVVTFTSSGTVTDYFTITANTNNNASIVVTSSQANASFSVLAKGTGGVVVGSAGATTTPFALQQSSNTISFSVPTLTGNRTLTIPDVNTDLTVATQGQQETGTQTVNAVTSGTQQYHPSSAKAWVQFNTITSTSITSSYNITSLTDNGTGLTTITIATDFSGANYCATGMSKDNGAAAGSVIVINTRAAGSLDVITFTPNSLSAADSGDVNVAFFGDQA